MNRLPSSAIKFDTPYHQVHNRHPDYSCLRVFGSRCYPYTWDTKRNKFDPKTLPCIFVGYSNNYKGYRCFHPSSRRFFIFHLVAFSEDSFPYKSTEQLATASSFNITKFNDWIDPTNIDQSFLSIQDSITPATGG